MNVDSSGVTELVQVLFQDGVSIFVRILVEESSKVEPDTPWACTGSDDVAR